MRTNRHIRNLKVSRPAGPRADDEKYSRSLLRSPPPLKEDYFVLPVHDTKPVNSRALIAHGTQAFGARGYNAGVPVLEDLVIQYTLPANWVALVRRVKVTPFIVVAPDYINDPPLNPTTPPIPAAPVPDLTPDGYINNDGVNGQIVNAFSLEWFANGQRQNPEGPVFYSPSVIGTGVDVPLFFTAESNAQVTTAPTVEIRIRPLRSRYETYVADWQLEGDVLVRGKGDSNTQQAIQSVPIKGELTRPK